MEKDDQVQYWKKMYENLLAESVDPAGKYNSAEDVINALKPWIGDRKHRMQIVFKNHFYSIADIYSIEDDTDYDYLCIEAKDTP